MTKKSSDLRLTVSRRVLLQSGAAAGVLVATGLPKVALAQAEAAPVAFERRVVLGFGLNGQQVARDIDPRTSLLDLLREDLGLTGAKKGCDHGQCGACTVHLDGRRVASCLTPVAQVDGREVVTIEGVAQGEELHPMQQAFIDNEALQCGYCTPGQIMAAIACVDEGHAGSLGEIREYMSGNLCRCGAYPGIVAAVAQAAQNMEG